MVGLEWLWIRCLTHTSDHFISVWIQPLVTCTGWQTSAQTIWFLPDAWNPMKECLPELYEALDWSNRIQLQTKSDIDCNKIQEQMAPCGAWMSFEPLLPGSFVWCPLDSKAYLWIDVNLDCSIAWKMRFLSGSKRSSCTIWSLYLWDIALHKQAASSDAHWAGVQLCQACAVPKVRNFSCMATILNCRRSQSVKLYLSGANCCARPQDWKISHLTPVRGYAIHIIWRRYPLKRIWTALASSGKDSAANANRGIEFTTGTQTNFECQAVKAITYCEILESPTELPEFSQSFRIRHNLASHPGSIFWEVGTLFLNVWEEFDSLKLPKLEERSFQSLQGLFYWRLAIAHEPQNSPPKIPQCVLKR